jgi:hypothetical protein
VITGEIVRDAVGYRCHDCGYAFCVTDDSRPPGAVEVLDTEQSQTDAPARNRL